MSNIQLYLLRPKAIIKKRDNNARMYKNNVKKYESLNISQNSFNTLILFIILTLKIIINIYLLVENN